jgi:Zn-dependent protease with chaperone function
MFPITAQFFDGDTATTHKVDVAADADGLTISGPTIGTIRRWNFKELHAAELPTPGEPLRLRRLISAGERLVISDGAAIESLKAAAPQILGGVRPRQAARLSLLIAAGLTAVVGVGYLLLTIAPPALARIMPERWRDRLGVQTQEAFLHKYGECRSAAGTLALNELADRLYEGSGNLAPKFNVSVYRMPVINAFALPGGRIAISGKLLEAASGPEEVAGVLAHELGHVANLHPEAALVRLAGLQLLISLVTSSDGGTLLSSVAGIATFLRYSRAAEEAADAYALEMMESSKIDPMGLKRFFERIQGTEGYDRRDSAGLGQLLNIFSTHPGTRERIAKIKPLASGPARTVIDDVPWAALKSICT